MSEDGSELASTQAGTGEKVEPGVEPSGYKGDNPATAGPGGAPAGHINPSAPEDSNVTPGSTVEK